jgi:hypothetical protein
MSPTQDEPTLQEMSRRLTELEQVHARLHEELGALQAKHSTAREQLRPLPQDVLGVFSSSVAGTPAVSATGTNGAHGVTATSDSGTGVYAQSSNLLGLHAVGGGANPTPPDQLPKAAILAEGGPSLGIFATSNGDAIYVNGGNELGSFAIRAVGMHGGATSGGVSSYSYEGTGVVAQSAHLVGLHAVGGGAISTPPDQLPASAVYADGGPGFGVYALNDSAASAILAQNNNGDGVDASSTNGTGVYAQSSNLLGLHAVGGGATPAVPPPITQAAIFAEGGPNVGVYATSQSSTGVQGQSDTSTGVSGITESGFGVTANGGSGGVALQVIGKIEVQGNLVGSVTMAAGKKTLTVNNAAATANSLILLTPLNNPQAFLWIGARKAGSFTIDASKALPTNVTILFLIIN